MSERAAAVLLLLSSSLGCALPTSLGQLSADTDGATGSSTGQASTTTLMPASSSSGPEATTSGDTDSVLELHTWVMRYDDYVALEPDPPGTDSGMDSGGGGTGDGPAPDSLVVQISTGPDDCDDPWASVECGGQWSIFMLIPPELQVPGEYSIFEDLGGFFIVSGPVEPGDQCAGGGGTLEGVATLTVVSEQEVSGQLSMTDAIDFDANIAFTALGCG